MGLEFPLCLPLRCDRSLKWRSDLHNVCTIHNSEVLAMARFNTGRFLTPSRQEKIISCIWYLVVFVSFIICFRLSELYSLSSSKYCFFLFFIFGTKLLLFFCKVSGSLIVTFFFVSSTSLYKKSFVCSINLSKTIKLYPLFLFCRWYSEKTVLLS